MTPRTPARRRGLLPIAVLVALAVPAGCGTCCSTSR